MNNQIATRFDGFKDSIFTKMTALAIQNGAVNLGQGAPDEEPEQFIKEAAAKAMMTAHHQYQRSQGAPPLVKSLANLYSKQLNREIDPMTNVHVGVGATEVGYCAFNTLVNPGDKVVLFEPFFDCYDAWTKVVDAQPVYVPLKHFSEQSNPCIGQDDEVSTRYQKDGILRSDDFTFDHQKLSDSLKDARVLLLNNPHNPLGKIFSKREMEFIAEQVRKNPNLIVISDEVYEFLSHKVTDIEHSIRSSTPTPTPSLENLTTAPLTRFASIPDMWERTITVSSAGKTFNTTGWKIGWGIGPSSLIKPLSIGHQWVTFSVAAPLQHALAEIIEEAQVNGYFERLGDLYTKKRDLLYQGLYKAGLNPIYPSAGYFVVCQGSSLVPRLGLDGVDGSDEKQQDDVVDSQKQQEKAEMAKKKEQELGVELATRLTTQVGVTSIPVSEFYSDDHKTLGNTLLRFAYCKRIDVIEAGMEKLAKWNEEKKD